MKMRLIGFLAFALLSISILSYGTSGVAFATVDLNPALPVSTDLEIVGNGVTVIVSGTLPKHDPSSGKTVTFIVVSPEKGFVQIGQLTPNADGYFETSIVAGGPLWKSSGEYIIKLQHGPDQSEVSIDYVGGETKTPDVVPPIEPDVVIPPPPIEPDVVEPPIEPIGVDPPPPPPPKSITCGPGTEMVDGICKVKSQASQSDEKSGCLIATATYGTELAPQVQLLREIRDNTLFSTTSGTSFMVGFNTLYYSFAPTISDWERENAMFKEAVKIFITPMLSTLSIMSLADEGSEAEVLGFGISVIILNLGMYIAAPALIGFKAHQHIKSRK